MKSNYRRQRAHSLKYQQLESREVLAAITAVDGTLKIIGES